MFPFRMSTKVRALLSSFLLYLFPIIGPHGLFFWGQVLWQEVTAARGEREALWIVADLALALSLQFLLFVLLIWIIRGRTWRHWIAILPVAVVLMGALSWLYLVVIPTHFLISPERALAQTKGEVACTIPNAAVAQVRSGVQLELAQAGEVWIERLAERGYGILTMPGCKVREIDIDRIGPQGLGNVEFVAPGGAALLRRGNSPAEVEEVAFLSGEGGDPVPVLPPDEGNRWKWQPVLSSDGQAIAWLVDRVTNEKVLPAIQVRLRGLPDGGERTVELDEALVHRPQLIALDASRGELVITNNSREVLGVGLEGELLWGPVRVESIGFLWADNFRRHAGGWLAWDLPGEEGPFSVSWSLILGEGTHHVSKGRSITSVALDPWSRYIAISVSPRYSVGRVRDAVYVIRSSDGQEVYRRYLKPYARSQVAFVGPHFLALTRNEETAGKATLWVEVLRIPGPTPIAQVRRWIEAYRQVILPLLPMYEKFDRDGIGEEDCAPLHQALTAASQVPRFNDQVTTSTYEALTERLEEAVYQCDRWDPGPFSDAFAQIEFLITGVEDSLIYEHGLQALAEAESESLRFDGYSIRPFQGPDGELRAKRFR